MSSKLLDFLSSFGMMILGVVLLFAGSVTFEPAEKFPWLQFPVAGSRTLDENIEETETLPLSRPRVPLRTNADSLLSISAASAIAVDSETQTVLFQKNIRDERPLASITKLMTALVLLDMPVNWASTTAVIEADADGSDHHIMAGEEYTLEDLWNIALIGSSNIAVNALVRGAGFSAEQLVVKMNEKARELGLASANFVDLTGLSDRNTANALDTVALLRKALQREKIYRTAQKKEFFAKPINKKIGRRVWSTNRLLTRWIPNKFGYVVGKTGYTSQAGYNFVAGIEDGRERSLFVVVLGATSTEGRFTEARDLAEWVFQNYSWPGDAFYEAVYNSSTRIAQ